MDAFGIYFPIFFWLVVFLMAAFVVSRAKGLLRSQHARRRAGQAKDGEVRAEKILLKAGYRILERQKSFKHKIWVDDEPLQFLLRFDYVVEKNNQILLAEVKTGDFAPSLQTAATRRQLLEYATALGHQEILLVDAFDESIKVVSFNSPSIHKGASKRHENTLDFSKTPFSKKVNVGYWTEF